MTKRLGRFFRKLKSKSQLKAALIGKMLQEECRRRS